MTTQQAALINAVYTELAPIHIKAVIIVIIMQVVAGAGKAELASPATTTGGAHIRTSRLNHLNLVLITVRG